MAFERDRAAVGLDDVADFKAYLASKGIALGADQSAKTKSSLECFSTRLQGLAS